MSKLFKKFIPSKRTTGRNTQEDQYGLIILGNSGVGKSFLANILVGHEAFTHAFSVNSVTQQTEYVEIQIGGLPLAIFNIPGLIEAEQERIDLNKIEIDKAFKERPNSVILFVFGHQNGRIRDEDVVAFNAINAAYPFRPESLVIVVNSLPKTRPSDYEGTTLVLLQKLLVNTNVNSSNLCFLDVIEQNSMQERQNLKENLLKVLVEFTPREHIQRQEINTLMDELKNWKKAIKQQQAEFDAERDNFRQQIQENQRVLNETITTHRSEAESLRRALDKQQEMFTEQQREFSEERKAQDEKLRRLLDEMEKARQNYEELKRSHDSNREAVQAAEAKYRQLQEELERQKSESFCTIL